MKKLVKILCVALCFALGLTFFAGCGEKNILVVSRESGSGTRDAFEGFVKKDKTLAEWLKTAGNDLVSGEEKNTSSAVLITVENGKNAIGYTSYGAVKGNTKVKCISVNGKAPSSPDYDMQRPFVIMTTKKTALTPLAENFYSYIRSGEAQTVVTREGYFDVGTGKTGYESTGGAYTPFSGSVPAASSDAGKIVIRGSTSVEPLMRKLVAEYITKNAGVTDANFDIDCKGSGVGRTAADDDDKGNVIGMSSSHEIANASKYNICAIADDYIAVIVHKDNALDNLTYAQLFDIYTGAIKKFGEIA